MVCAVKPFCPYVLYHFYQNLNVHCRTDNSTHCIVLALLCPRFRINVQHVCKIKQIYVV
jgi:hypothetical protein